LTIIGWHWQISAAIRRDKTMDKFDVLKTSRLMIRTLAMQDLEPFFRYRSLPEVYRYQAWRPSSASEAADFIARNEAIALNTPNTWLQLAVCLPNGQLIGDLGVHFLDDEQVEIGYTLAPEYQGYGYAAEAVRALADYLFSRLKKHRITASVDPGNTQSIRLLEKVGFQQEAHFRQSLYLGGKWHDDCVYALLADDVKSL